MDIKNNIKLFSSFRKTIDALYGIILAIRIVAVVFLILQAILVITQDKTTIFNKK